MKQSAKLSDFDFELPEALIATRPARPRSSAKMLLAQDGQTKDMSVCDLPQILQKGDRLVLNNTKVIPARLFGTRQRNSAQGLVSAKIEATLLGAEPDGCWQALIKPLRKLNIGEVVQFSDELSATLLQKDDGHAILQFNLTGDEFDAGLASAGAMPLPPYIAAKRAADERDKVDYQTVFARHQGAVAAPTASLHFDDALLAELAAIGVDFSYVTLHVGAGTFLPVKTDDISQHKMHSEWGEINETAAREINQTRQNGGRIIPVGTTALRLIETAATPDGQMIAWRGDTDIFIKPGYKFKITDALMTNFHLPKSTLLMLVSALMGKDRLFEIYAHAIKNDYRFFSYGDASILFPKV